MLLYIQKRTLDQYFEGFTFSATYYLFKIEKNKTKSLTHEKFKIVYKHI